MFKKPLTEDEVEVADTIIAKGVKVDGNFASKGDIIIDGIVKGSVKTEHDLRVGEKAQVTASIIALNAFVSGELNGNIKIKERLELAPTARIFGDLEAKTLIVNPGALINGKCTMTPEEGSPAAIAFKNRPKIETPLLPQAQPVSAKENSITPLKSNGKKP